MLPLALLILIDSRAPAGAHSHSSGMEPAVAAGLVRDVDDVAAFCAARVRTGGRVAAAFAAASCRGWLMGLEPHFWLALDRELDARIASEAARGASRAMGSGLRRLVAATAPASWRALQEVWSLCPRPAPHHPVVLGAAAAAVGAQPAMAGRAAMLASVSGPASAALRLLGLDPYQVQAITAALAAAMEQAADEATALADAVVAAVEVAGDGAALADLPADGVPGLDVLADVHLLQEVRLFAS